MVVANEASGQAPDFTGCPSQSPLLRLLQLGLGG